MAAIAGRATPATVSELVAIAYVDTPQALWPLAERSLLSHAIKLVRDGRVRVITDAVAITEHHPGARFASVANPL